MFAPKPFARFHALMSLAVAAMHAGKAATMSQAISMSGGYQSRGKRASKPHDNGGTRAFQRSAQKKRNQQRHRRACRG